MGRHRRQGAHVKVPAPRTPRPLGVTEALTCVQHLVTDEAYAAHRHSGNYLALCGARFRAASLTTPERSRCGHCEELVARPAASGRPPVELPRQPSLPAAGRGGAHPCPG